MISFYTREPQELFLPNEEKSPESSPKNVGKYIPANNQTADVTHLTPQLHQKPRHTLSKEQLTLIRKDPTLKELFTEILSLKQKEYAHN